MADQALSSLTNLFLGIAVAREVEAAQFGAFSIVFITYVLALGLSRALVSEPFSVVHSMVGVKPKSAPVGAALGAAVALGSAVGLAILLVAGGTSGAVRESFAALAITLPGLLLQDACRWLLFADKRGSSAFVNDLVWAAMLLATVGFALTMDLRSSGSLILVWGCSASTAALFGIWQVGEWPKVRRTLHWWQEHKEFAGRYLLEFATVTAAGYLAMYGVVLVSGLGAVAAIRGAVILLGPLTVLFSAVGIAGIPETVGLKKREPARLVTAIALLSGLLTTVALCWGAVLLWLPTGLGRALLGDSWEPARHVLVPMAIHIAGLGAIAGPAIGLRALRAPRRSLRVRLTTGPLTFVGGMAGALIQGGLGAAWGLATATAVATFFWWREFRGAAQDLHPVGQTEVAGDHRDKSRVASGGAGRP